MCFVIYSDTYGPALNGPQTPDPRGIVVRQRFSPRLSPEGVCPRGLHFYITAKKSLVGPGYAFVIMYLILWQLPQFQIALCYSYRKIIQNWLQVAPLTQVRISRDTLSSTSFCKQGSCMGHYFTAWRVPTNCKFQPRTSARSSTMQLRSWAFLLHSWETYPEPLLTFHFRRGLDHCKANKMSIINFALTSHD